VLDASGIGLQCATCLTINRPKSYFAVSSSSYQDILFVRRPSNNETFDEIAVSREGLLFNNSSSLLNCFTEAEGITPD